jgi:large subunit ribosomal protein L31
MKKKTHPRYYPQAKVTCACGASFTTGSTKPEIEVEICSACHPFFTGEMKYVDTQGRVEKFISQQEKAKKEAYVKKKVRREKKRKGEEKKEKTRPKSLKEMLKKKG